MPSPNRPSYSSNSQYTSPSKKQRLNSSSSPSKNVQDQRHDSLNRLRETWESIALRYAEEEEEDDVFDLSTCDVVEDNGWLRSRTQALPFGSFALQSDEEQDEDGSDEDDEEQQESSEQEEEDSQQTSHVKLDSAADTSEDEFEHTLEDPAEQQQEDDARSSSSASSRSAFPSQSPSLSNPPPLVMARPLRVSPNNRKVFQKSILVFNPSTKPATLRFPSPPMSHSSTASSLFSHRSASTAATSSPSPGPSSKASSQLRRPSPLNDLPLSNSTKSTLVRQMSKAATPSPNLTNRSTSSQACPLIPGTTRTNTPNLLLSTRTLSIHSPTKGNFHLSPDIALLIPIIATPSRSRSRSQTQVKREPSIFVLPTTPSQNWAGSEKKWVISRTPLRAAARCPGDWSEESDDPLDCAESEEEIEEPPEEGAVAEESGMSSGEESV